MKPKIFTCQIRFTVFRSKVIELNELGKLPISKPEDILSDVHTHAKIILK